LYGKSIGMSEPAVVPELPWPGLQDKRLRIDIDVAGSVSALLRVPKLTTACYVFARGAGAG